MLRQDDAIKAQLVFYAYRHGLRYGGHIASCMIMGVIVNRTRAGWGTFLEMIDRAPTFSAELTEPLGMPTIWEPNFVRLLHEVETIYEGTQHPSKDAMYWCDSRYIETEFFREKILKQPEAHPRIMEMGSLMFFK